MSNTLNISKVKSSKEGQGLIIPPPDNQLRYSSRSINFSFAINFSLQSVLVVRSSSIFTIHVATVTATCLLFSLNSAWKISSISNKILSLSSLQQMSSSQKFILSLTILLKLIFFWIINPWCVSPFSAGWIENQTFKRGTRGLTGPQSLRGSCWERGVAFSRVVAVFIFKIN